MPSKKNTPPHSSDDEQNTPHSSQQHNQSLEELPHQKPGSDDVDSSVQQQLYSNGSTAALCNNDEYITVHLPDVRKQLECPICLDIIRKTRTVVECVHRFCRECIDKSMRLWKNECPVCRTHCASRGSLRDDPKYDALITALHPNMDKYEEEELAFHEEERDQSKQIQASISQTVQQQSEALGKKHSSSRTTAAAYARKSQVYQDSRGTRNQRANEQQGSRASGRGGTRSTSRQRKAQNNVLEIHLTLVPLDEQRIPSLQCMHVCCSPTVSIRYMCQYVGLKTDVGAEEVEIILVKGLHSESDTKVTSNVSISRNTIDTCKDKLHILEEHETLSDIMEKHETLSELQAMDSVNRRNLVFAYKIKKLSSSTHSI